MFPAHAQEPGGRCPGALGSVRSGLRAQWLFCLFLFFYFSILLFYHNFLDDFITILIQMISENKSRKYFMESSLKMEPFGTVFMTKWI